MTRDDLPGFSDEAMARFAYMIDCIAVRRLELCGSYARLRLFSQIRRFPGINANSLHLSTGISKTTVYRVVKDLEAEGIIEEINGDYSPAAAYRFTVAIPELTQEMYDMIDLCLEILKSDPRNQTK